MGQGGQMVGDGLGKLGRCGWCDGADALKHYVYYSMSKLFGLGGLYLVLLGIRMVKKGGETRPWF
jgi:hypothetical protein